MKKVTQFVTIFVTGNLPQDKALRDSDSFRRMWDSQWHTRESNPNSASESYVQWTYPWHHQHHTEFCSAREVLNLAQRVTCFLHFGCSHVTISIYCKSTIYFRRHNNIMVYLLNFNITYINILATCFVSYESSSGINFKNYFTYCFTVLCLTQYRITSTLLFVNYRKKTKFQSK